MQTPAEKYLSHLDTVFQREPLFVGNESTNHASPGVTSIIYRDIPEKGYITGLTYGLSIIDHPSWKISRPELCISVRSDEITWGTVAGYVANRLRGDCTFCYGDVINFNGRISADSEMDAFLLFAPSILGPEDFRTIDIGVDYSISISGLYPIYSDEISVYESIGLERFWHHPNFDIYDVNRMRVTAD